MEDDLIFNARMDGVTRTQKRSKHISIMKLFPPNVKFEGFPPNFTSTKTFFKVRLVAKTKLYERHSIVTKVYSFNKISNVQL